MIRHEELGGSNNRKLKTDSIVKVIAMNILNNTYFLIGSK